MRDCESRHYRVTAPSRNAAIRRSARNAFNCSGSGSCGLSRAALTMHKNPIGSPRKDWRKVLVGDGLVVVRHPDHETARAMAERVAAGLHIVAG